MRKTNLSLIVKRTALILGLCSFLISCPSPTTNPENSGSDSNSEGNSETPGTATETVYVIDAATTTALDNHSWYIASISLQDFAEKTVNINFSADMMIENSGDAANIMWSVNALKEDGSEVYPTVASKEFSSGTSEWTTVTGTGSSIILGKYPVLYISTYNITPANLTISVKNIKAVVTETSDSANTKTLTEMNEETGITKKTSAAENQGGTGSDAVSERTWSKLSSLKEAYVDSGIFDHFGFATTMAEITGKSNHKDKAALMAKHGNTTSMGNEMKPQWILWNYGTKVSTNGTFTASNGKTISVPVLPASSDTEHGLGGIGTALQIAKDKGIQMRGHVLTWHSQTFDWFFCEDYDVSKGLTDKDTMTARHEWYIKTVLEYVADWETKNNGGKHIIYTWDVVNEAVADDALGDTYLRGSTEGTSTKIPVLASGCHSENGTSRWYQIYGNDEFIINAFRFANKYAPADVTLCYNDYNEYYEWSGHTTKRSGIIKVLNAVLEHKNDAELPTRLDAFGMQSHLEDWVALSSVESAIQEFLKLGIDLQVTELDFAWNTEKYTKAKTNLGYSGTKLEDLYSDHMKLYIKYAKSKRSAQGNGITSVTLWAVEDKDNWLNKDNIVYYPSLFERDSSDNLVAKDAFFAVLNAAK